MGGASASVIGVMFGVYKLVTLMVNHRCRSDCCGRFFSLGIAVEETTPPPHRHVITGEATLNHRLLGREEMNDGTTDGFVPVRLRPLPSQSTSPAENRNRWSGVEEDTSSLEPTHQSISLPIQPSSDLRV